MAVSSAHVALTQRYCCTLPSLNHMVRVCSYGMAVIVRTVLTRRETAFAIKVLGHQVALAIHCALGRQVPGVVMVVEVVA